MKKVAEIENTNIGIYANNNYLIYQHDGNVIQRDFENSLEQILFSTDFETHSIEVIDDTIFLTGSKGYTKFKGNNSEYIESQIGDYEIHLNQFLATTVDYDYNNFLPKSGFVDVFSNELVWTGEYGETIKSKKGNVFSISNIKLAKRTHQTGAIEWVYEFDETNLIPTLSIGKAYTLLAINERDLLICFSNQTGQKLWENNTISRGILIDESEESFHQFLINYNSYNLADGTLLKSKIDREYFKDIGIENQKDNYLQIENSLILNDSRTKTVGRFNTEKLKFDWIEKGISIPEGYKMKKNKDYIFLVDSNKKLTIYKWNTR